MRFEPITTDEIFHILHLADKLNRSQLAARFDLPEHVIDWILTGGVVAISGAYSAGTARQSNFHARRS